MKYNKLVRDRIPYILDAKGKEYSVRQCTECEKLEYLKRKLIEEVDEFLEEPSVEELADIQEVLLSLSSRLGFTRQDLEQVRETKNATRGAFNDNWILEEVL